MNVANVSDDRQSDRLWIEFAAGGGAADSAAASFGGVCRDLTCFGQWAHRELVQDRDRHLLDQSLIEHDSMNGSDSSASSSLIGVGDALVLGLSQSFA